MLADVKRRSDIYLKGLKYIINNPQKLSALLNDELNWVKRLPVNIIDRVKKPLSWYFSAELKLLTNEECQLQIKEGPRSLTPLLYSAEECLESFLQTTFLLPISYRIVSSELNIHRDYDYPVDCVFSMDIDTKSQLEMELKLHGQSQQSCNLSLLANNIEFGHVFFEVVFELPKALPPVK